jgi:hypothetical protein
VERVQLGQPLPTALQSQPLAEQVIQASDHRPNPYRGRERVSGRLGTARKELVSELHRSLKPAQRLDLLPLRWCELVYECASVCERVARGAHALRRGGCERAREVELGGAQKEHTRARKGEADPQAHWHRAVRS